MNISRLFLPLVLSLIPLVSHAQCETSVNISTVAGNHTEGYSGDGGAGTSGQMGSPYCVAADASGNVYIADYFNNVVRMVSSTGTISTIAGNGTPGYNGDNIAATAAMLYGPAGVTLDGAGNLLIADQFNERIRRVNLSSGIITSIAGNGNHGGWLGHDFGNDGPATAAALTYPVSVALDCSGNIFVADVGSHTVRRISPSGIISRFAGTHEGGYNGDGIAATAAQLYQPSCVAADCSGNVYISDSWNNRVRKVDASGYISTFAGNGIPAYTGDGAAANVASLWVPWGITLDACGNMYICDYNNNAVRKVTPSGTISTFAGNNTRGYTGDGGPATAAAIYLPVSLALGGSGNVYIADYGNFVIRLIGSTGYASRAFMGGTTQSLNACATTPVKLDELMAVYDIAGGKTETWTVNSTAQHGTLGGFSTAVVSAGGKVIPSGLTYMAQDGYFGTDEFTILMSDGSTSASTTITVTINPIPLPGTISGGTVVDPSGQLRLTTIGADAGGIWTSGDKTIATIDNSGNVTAIANGVSIISYTVSNSCGERTATAKITSRISDIPTGKMLVFPNPSNGTFRLNFMADTESPLDLVITDILGKVVLRQTINAVTGINVVNVTLPDTLLITSVLRLTVGTTKGSKYETATLTVQR